MKRERVVVDTNVLISGLLSTISTPARALEFAATSDQMVATSATLRELMTKLLSPKSTATCRESAGIRCSSGWRLS